jgi:hypothetical protein
MSLFEILVSAIKGMFPGFVYWAVLPSIPFIIAEPLRPGAEAPRLRDYRINILVTPPVHRIHHSVNAKHYNRNFADALPIFDVVFRTFHRPVREEFSATGLGPDSSAPHSLWSTQLGPIVAVGRLLATRKQGERNP